LEPVVHARNRRRAGRVHCEGLHCSWGRVIDLSATGAKVYMHLRRPGVGQLMTVQMPTPIGTITLMARTAWVRSAGFLAWEAGCEFAPMCEEVRSALLSAMHAGIATETLRQAA